MKSVPLQGPAWEKSSERNAGASALPNWWYSVASETLLYDHATTAARVRAPSIFAQNAANTIRAISGSSSMATDALRDRGTRTYARIGTSGNRVDELEGPGDETEHHHHAVGAVARVDHHAAASGSR